MRAVAEDVSGGYVFGFVHLAVGSLEPGFEVFCSDEFPVAVLLRVQVVAARARAFPPLWHRRRAGLLVKARRLRPHAFNNSPFKH